MMRISIVFLALTIGSSAYGDGPPSKATLDETVAWMKKFVAAGSRSGSYETPPGSIYKQRDAWSTIDGVDECVLLLSDVQKEARQYREPFQGAFNLNTDEREETRWTRVPLYDLDRKRTKVVSSGRCINRVGWSVTLAVREGVTNVIESGGSTVTKFDQFYEGIKSSFRPSGYPRQSNRDHPATLGDGATLGGCLPKRADAERLQRAINHLISLCPTAPAPKRAPDEPF